MTYEFPYDPELIFSMREYARKGKSIREIAELIRESVSTFNTVVVCECFMIAFNLRFFDVKELRGASFIDGVVSNEYIEGTVGCAIRNAQYSGREIKAFQGCFVEFEEIDRH